MIMEGHEGSAGFHWDAKFNQAMASLGGQHLDNIFQSSFWFKKERLSLTLYVDGMLRGPCFFLFSICQAPARKWRVSGPKLRNTLK